ncbi:uncharacterized protein CDAR_495061 [Caerostris darwini]|uniref:Cytochrome c oxidase subunit 4 n=1 Tax=Caerostris darwini TaxID=1538125 RepID=A0AAV4U7A8_9ARAC|nr:uncharacterized protein CDAR_495061 [Caerostris darwini]
MVCVLSGLLFLSIDSRFYYCAQKVLLTSSAKTINGNGFVDDPCITQVAKPSKISRTPSLLSLKQKEKGDWRNLTLEEKQALYHLSFNNPLCYVDEPADEWKLILAGTFTAMGLMTLGMYVWLSQSEQTEVIGPLSKKIKNLEISSFEENSLVKMS